MRVRGILAILAVGMLTAVAQPARAQCAGFVDVAVSDPACGGISWIKARAITIGCTIPNSFCPGEPVGRLTMALFMHRLGNLLTPSPLGAEESGSSLDVSTENYLCQTPLVPAVGYARTFLGDVGLSFVASGTGSLMLAFAASINGGPFGLVTGNVRVSFTAGTLVNVAHISQNATMTANSSYRFAVRVLEAFGAPITLTSWSCNLQSDVVNLNT